MYLCRHAIGNVEDYVKEAIRIGLDSLGMSDHAPFAELKDRSIRMDPDDFPTYLRECDEAIRKYSGKIKIFKALEIEYFDGYEKMYEGYLRKLDYLALGQHYISDAASLRGLKSCYTLSTLGHVRTYVDTIIKALESKFFRFVCHPDLMFYNIGKLDESIMNESSRLIRCAIENDIPLEINANGVRKGLRLLEDGVRYLYPRLEFWKKVREMGAKVIVSADAHDPSYLYDDGVLETYRFATQIGIEVEEALNI